MSCATLASMLSEETPPNFEGVPHFPPLHLGAYLAKNGERQHESAPVTPARQVGVPSEAVAEMICSHVVRSRAARALSILSSDDS